MPGNHDFNTFESRLYNGIFTQACCVNESNDA